MSDRGAADADLPVASLGALGVVVLIVVAAVATVALAPDRSGGTDTSTTVGDGEWATVEDVAGNATVTVTYTTGSNGTRQFVAPVADPRLSNADSDWAIVKGSTLPSALAAVDGNYSAGVVRFGPWALVGRTRTATVPIDGTVLTVVVPAGREVDPRRKAGFLYEFLSPYSLAPGESDRPVTLVSVPRALPSKGLLYHDDRGYVTQRAFWDGDVESVWIHEFVHARQNARLEPGMQWFTEASAEYLSYRVMEEQYEEVSEADVRDRFESIPTYVGTELADPSTWRDTDADYLQGAYLLYAIDNEIRAGSDGEHTLVDVFRAMNARDGRISIPEFVRIVERYSGADEDWITASITDGEALKRHLDRVDFEAFGE